VFIDSEQLLKLIETAAELPATLKTILVRGEFSPDVKRHFRGKRWLDCMPSSLLPRHWTSRM
jgi:hypothetical protein